MKKEWIFLLSFILVIGVAIGTSMLGKSSETTSSEPTGESATNETSEVVVTQLSSDERADSATMVLVGSPPVLPDDHASFWNPEIGYDSCMVCHNTPETGAPTPTPEHYYEDNIDKGIFRDYCIQCHVTQESTQSAFNDQK
jgi:nitrate reductase (cytochrome), electron transfer subunit